MYYIYDVKKYKKCNPKKQVLQEGGDAHIKSRAKILKHTQVSIKTTPG